MSASCATHRPHYKAGCFGCAEKARTHYASYARRRAANGGGRLLIDVEPEVFPHVCKLTDAGFRVSDIEDASGVARSVVSRIRRGDTKRVTPGVAKKLLAVRLADLEAAASSVPIGETRRMIQHLHLRGFSASQVSRGTGVGRSVIFGVLGAGQKTLRKADAEAIADFYEAHWNDDGGSNRARFRALRSKWRPYLREIA